MAALLDDVNVTTGPAVFGPELSPEFSDEFGDEFEQDLPSGALGDTSAGARMRARLRPTGDPVSAATKRKLQGELQLWLELLNGLWGLRCEHCADHNQQYIENLSKRLTNLAARYPDLVEKLTTGGLIADSIAVASAAAPIVRHAVGHHVTHSIRYGDEELDDGVNVDQYTQYAGR